MGVPVLIATTTAQASTAQTTFTIDRPPGAQADDLLVIKIRGQSTTASEHFSLAGWTLESENYDLASGPGSSARRVSDVLSRRITDVGSEPTEYTWSRPAGFSANRMLAILELWRNVHEDGVVAAGFSESTTYAGHDVPDGIESATSISAMAEFTSPNDHAGGSLPAGWDELAAAVNPSSGSLAVSRTAIRTVYRDDSADPIGSTSLPFVGTPTAPVTIGITLRGIPDPEPEPEPGFPADARALKLWGAFGHTASEDPTGITFEQIAPHPDDDEDPGPALGVVSIARGRLGDQGATDPTAIETALRNAEGAFSPRNVTGPYYGRLRMGTPIQVTVDIGAGDQPLATAYQPSWSPTWRGPDIDDRVGISARGILGQLGRVKIEDSAPVTYIPTTDPIAYWPLEDGPLASVGRALAGDIPLRPFVGEHPSGAVISYPEWGRGNLGPWLKPVVSRSGTADLTAMWARVYMRMSATTWTVDLIYASGTAAGGDEAALAVDINPSWLPADIAGSGWPQLGFVPSAREMFVTLNSEPEVGFSTPTLYDGLGHHVRWTVSQDGGNGEWSVWVDGELVSTGTTSGAMTVDPIRSISLTAPASGGAGVAHGHVAIWETPPDLGDAVNAALGYRGESAADRITRLCQQAGVPVVVAAGDSTAMDSQPPGDLLSLLRDCEAADHGVLYELRDGRLAYQPRTARYNIDPSLTLAFGAEADPRDVSDLVQVDDDRDLYNIATVTRESSGASATVEQTDGLVGTSELTGVGPRPLPPVSLNLATDDQARQHAGWLLNVHTVDKPRYVVVLDLYNNPQLADDWLAIDIGSRIQITGAPAKHAGPDALDLIVEGEDVEVSADRWLVRLWCEPYDPYAVFVVGDPVLGRLDTKGSSLALGVDKTETTLIVATDSGRRRWITTAERPQNFPFAANVGGEVVKVSAISGTVSPQTFTVERSFNGVEKAHLAGTDVRIARVAVT